MSTTRDLTFAQRLADRADVITMASFLDRDLQVDTKPDLTPVSAADRAVEQALRDMIAEVSPGDAILGEEYGTSGHGDRTWIIDPIDGTKNYVRGVPVWATLIALRVGEALTVGVVSAPALGRRWWAATGAGAWVRDPLGERAITVSGVSALADASLSVSDAVGWPPGRFDDLGARTWRSRGFGDFWSHLLVAEGAVDIAVEPQLQTYDMAALIPIVTEAGGQITGWHGGDPLDEGSAVTTNGHLHNQVVSALNP